ncbi:cbb3-type cytochrome c oxidase subunit I [Rickettsiales endosymbiont of Stachyamoeba lipophora]|uniref:cbb3-type cytochrome c oxidase subunit I n=1 Tax=Rickettsiales endosymbiont of Stachyamoeba lipophora TaxID=2486578 RepID=UPI000F6538F3|nr:cbb3-type cytochrome c oxidase subunit I [Rickettsiales endosymbiont of Stachyamoeba lipophora]AZL15167.1 hypothetical protein EF513_01145 [Rickettsiales endosymbiont of Stachyamoeba lipophora]
MNSTFLENISQPQKNQVNWWLSVGIISLIIAGLFSILIVFLRTPGIQNLFSNKDFFKTSLIIHVNLSVLVWLLSIGSIWSAVMIKASNTFFKVSPLLALIGAFLMSISIFTDGNAYLNNYIPIYHNPLFLLGLSIFFTAVILNSLMVIYFYAKYKSDDFSSFISLSLAIINLTSFIALFLTSQALSHNSHEFSLYEIYEYLFWGMGHILQFSFTQSMIAALIYLINFKQQLIKEQWGKLLLALNMCLGTGIIFWQILNNDIMHNYINLYTDHMRYFGGIAPGILIMMVGYHLVRSCLQIDKLSWHGSVLSLLLFSYGGILGYLIHGVNVVIPAHYHGSIVGVTVILMVFAIQVIKQMRFLEIPKSIFYQLYLYTIGQIIHISGLAWSGGYGALRKNPYDPLTLKAKIGMGIMGFGGLLAIIGGIMFVYIAGKMMLKKNNLMADSRNKVRLL